MRFLINNALVKTKQLVIKQHTIAIIVIAGMLTKNDITLQARAKQLHPKAVHIIGIYKSLLILFITLLYINH